MLKIVAVVLAVAVAGTRIALGIIDLAKPRPHAVSNEATTSTPATTVAPVTVTSAVPTASGVAAGNLTDCSFAVDGHYFPTNRQEPLQNLDLSALQRIAYACSTYNILRAAMNEAGTQSAVQADVIQLKAEVCSSYATVPLCASDQPTPLTAEPTLPPPTFAPPTTASYAALVAKCEATYPINLQQINQTFQETIGRNATATEAQQIVANVCRQQVTQQIQQGQG
jgi:hypothetical protein